MSQHRVPKSRRKASRRFVSLIGAGLVAVVAITGAVLAWPTPDAPAAVGKAVASVPAAAHSVAPSLTMSASALRLRNKGAFSWVDAPETFVGGSSTTVKAQLARRGATTVLLQYKSGSRWLTAKRAKSSSAGAVKFQVTIPSVSSRTFRLSARSRVTSSWTTKLRALSPSLSTAGYYYSGKTASFTIGSEGASAGSTLALQRFTGGKWRTVSSKKTTAARQKITVRASVPSSGTKFRTYVKAKDGRSTATASKAVYLVYPCSAKGAPARAVNYYSNDAKNQSYSSLMNPQLRAVCGAAKKSEIVVSTYILATKEATIRPFMRALEYKVRVDGVKLVWVLDSSSGAAAANTIKSLRSWSTVVDCRAGCMTFGKKLKAVNHQKFMLISDTTWRAGKDPYVWFSSANYSDRQLKRYWQNGFDVVNDAKLYASVRAEVSRMSKCTQGRAACVSTGLKHGKEFDVYGHGAVTLPTGTGINVSADFFPKATGGDPVQRVLQQMKCRPGTKTSAGGSRIRIMTYLWSDTRPAAILPQLERLAKEGCTVEVIYSSGGMFQPSPSALKQLKALEAKRIYTSAGRLNPVKMRGRNLMHAKTVVAENVAFMGKSNRYVSYAGAQNFTGTGLWVNNENMLLLEAPMSAASSSNGKLYGFRSGVNKQFERVWGTNTNCR